MGGTKRLDAEMQRLQKEPRGKARKQLATETKQRRQEGTDRGRDRWTDEMR